MKKKDSVAFIKIFRIWKNYSKLLKKYNNRGANIPEVLTEGIACYLLGLKRVNGQKGDAVDKKGQVVEIKASSIKRDLTSFSPKECDWDKFYFLDFYDPSESGNFKLYDLSKINFDTLLVTKTQSFKKHRKKQRRPRLSIGDIIKSCNIKPKYKLPIKNIEKFFKPYTGS